MIVRPLVVSLLFSLLLATDAIAVSQSEAQTYHFDLPGQSLADALTVFARQVGQTLVFNPATVKDIVVAPLSGDFSPQEALNRLLSHTPLHARRLGQGWVIKPTIPIPESPSAVPETLPVSVLPRLKTSSEVIEISGFRQLINQAKNIKREAIISQDSIVAEDIADFPDLNLADSLQRIPGVTITREAGEGRQISLRGLGPDFTRVQVNGMEALGTSSSPMDARGAVSRTRAFDFNIFASELFNQIDVKKSYSADQEEGGIGGTVNLTTAQPFDFNGFTSALAGQIGSNSNSDSSDPRLAGLISQRWQNIGLLVSAAVSQRQTMEYGTNTTRWRRETGKTAVQQADNKLQGLLYSGELWFPRGHRYSIWNNQQQRVGLTTSLQYRATEHLTLAADYLHGKLSNQATEHHLAVKDNERVRDLIWRDQNGSKQVVYASYQDATWRVENRRDYNTSTFDQLTLTADWQLNEQLSMQVLAGASSSDYAQPTVNKVNIQAKQKVDITTDFRADPFYGISLSTDFDLSASEAFTIKDLYFQEDYISNKFTNLQLDFKYFVGHSGTLQWGINYKTFENTGEQRSYEYVPEGSDLVLSAKLSHQFDGHPDISWVQANIPAIQQKYQLDHLRLGTQHTRAGSNFSVAEDTLAGYAMYNWEAIIAGQLFRASAGARFYHTRLTSGGLAPTNHTEQVRGYSGVLPSINISYELNDDMLWRFSANKNLTRPALNELSFSVDVSQTSLGPDEIGDITLGNPALKPFESFNLESAFEWYLQKLGMLSAALFYKDINNFIVNESSPVVYSQLGLSPALLPEGKTEQDIFNLISPQNSDATHIKGVELAMQRDLDFLPAPFDKLGIIANYTYADGSNLYRNVGDSGLDQLKRFPGLSENSYNLTLYYETPQWGARLASTYRSPYLTWAGESQDDDERGYHATTHYDFSAFYHLSARIKLSIEAINLSNVREELYSDSRDRAYNTTTSGRTYMMGLSARF